MITRREILRNLFTAVIIIFAVGELLWYHKKVHPWRDICANPSAYTEDERYLSGLQYYCLFIGMALATPLAGYFVYVT